jgi:hypothetical protein
MKSYLAQTQPMEINNAVYLTGWSPVMRHTDYRTLVDRGRKAGLKTADIYNALTSRRPEAGDRFVGETDGNGIIPGFDQHGQSVFRPSGNH